MRTIFTFLLFSLGLVLLPGCGGSESPAEPPKPPKPNPEPVSTAEVTYHFEGGEDLPNLFTFEAAYADADGKTAVAKISSFPWSHRVKVNLPFDANLNVRFAATEIYPSQPIYKVGYKGYISYKTSDGQSVMPVSTRADTRHLKFSFTLPEGASAEGASLRIAPLKYNKHFAFTFTQDDSYVNAFSRIWSLINAKWIDDKEFYHLGRTRTTGAVPAHPLVMTDGCGNDRRFGFSCAIWPTLGDNWNPTRIKDGDKTGDNSQYISWDELRLLADFGVSMCYHNVDERIYDKTNAAQIALGLEVDYQKTLEKLGLHMKVLGLPDGNKAYIEAARNFNRISFVRNSLVPATRIYLNTCGDLYKKETYGGTNSSVISVKTAELAEQAASDNPFWVGLTVHRPQQDYMDMLTNVYNLYGKAGADNLWVASWDEIYEYVALREGAKITRTVEGRTVSFDVELPAYDGYQFPQLSFLAEGVEGAVVTPVSKNIVGLKSASKQGVMLVNVNFDSHLLQLAEKYTAAFEKTAGDEELADARYFVSQLLPSLAAPFEKRIGGVENPGVDEVTAAGIEAYRTLLNGFELKVEQHVKPLDK